MAYGVLYMYKAYDYIYAFSTMLAYLFAIHHTSLYHIQYYLLLYASYTILYIGYHLIYTLYTIFTSYTIYTLYYLYCSTHTLRIIHHV